MTYQEIVNSVRLTFENADARRIFEHIAFEIDIVGDGAGTMYFEVANRACVIEPYNYYDNDGIFTADATVLMKLASLELHLAEAIEQGLIIFHGDRRKLQLCLDNIRLPGVKYD